VSVSDGRTRQFIKHAWKHLNKDFRVFWLCYSKSDVEQIQQFTKDFCHSRTPKEDGAKHSIILRHTDFGLFLLQLYQTIRKNLPPLGSLFPSVSRLTLPPMPSTYVHDPMKGESAQQGFSEDNNFSKEVRKHLMEFRIPGFCKYKLVVATSDADTRG